jgi:hypothetical protein
MIANLGIALTGLWLVYHAIFSIASGDLGGIETGVAGAAVILLAAWARRTDAMGWPSATNIVLGLIIVASAIAQRGIGLDPLASFWVLLLSGITAAIVALWSVLYRPASATGAIDG